MRPEVSGVRDEEDAELKGQAAKREGPWLDLLLYKKKVTN